MTALPILCKFRGPVVLRATSVPMLNGNFEPKLTVSTMVNRQPKEITPKIPDNRFFPSHQKAAQFALDYGDQLLLKGLPDF